MQAVVIDRFKTPGSLRDVPEPQLEPHTVLVRVSVAGVNPIDWKTRAGMAGERPFPLTLGQDFAGIVERVGDGVTRVEVGDRVFGCAREHGGYAQQTLVPEGQHDSPFTKILDGVSDTQAAALPTPGLTALGSLAALDVRDGTRLLVLGGAGAVGAAAVQVARQRGARVTAVVKPGQAADAKAFGAEHVVESGNDAVDAIEATHPDPFDAVLDLVSDGEALKKHAAHMVKGGKLVTTIHVADEAWFRAHEITASNLMMFDTPQSSPQGLDDLARMVAAGTLRVDVSPERPLAEAPAVLDEGAAGELHGKIVLRVSA